jgi:hypothetical protein
MADGTTRARAPYRRDRHYAYAVEYLIGGSRIVRVTRAATVFSPTGAVAAIVRPPARAYDPGRYRASSPIRIDPDDPAGLYRIRYTVLVRSRDGHSVRRQRELRARFV